MFLKGLTSPLLDTGAERVIYNGLKQDDLLADTSLIQNGIRRRIAVCNSFSDERKKEAAKSSYKWASVAKGILEWIWDNYFWAVECEASKRWTFFFTSSPLNIPSGVASPSNAIVVM
ncbi:hypothetical protein FRC06_002205 [Ceratobasidium sp. 370]|nr:hypothetical protein FRC06_002205 [Ceratobasidium sp. 370]